MSRRSIDGIRCILTGASSGIGQALATRLVWQGGRVVAIARRAERLERLANAVANAPGKLRTLAGDVVDEQVRRQAIELARADFGGLDLLINNAGVGAMGRFADAPPDRLRRVMEVNFFAPAELTRLAVPALEHGMRPMVVNIGSVLGHRAVPHCAEYCASKFALRGWSESLRPELAQRGIDVLHVSPATTQTEFFEAAIDAAPPRWRRPTGLSSDEVARRIVSAIRRGRHELVIGAPGKLLVWANRLLPWALDWYLARRG